MTSATRSSPSTAPPRATSLTALLEEHIQGAVALLKAAKAGDKARSPQATEAWYANADAIADFLNSANPHTGRIR